MTKRLIVAGALILALLIGGAGGAAFVLISGISSVPSGAIGSAKSDASRVEKVVVEQSSGVIDSVKKVSSSVVAITVKGQVIDFFFGPVSTSSAGTGFIVTADGLIITNKHVVADDKSEYTVFLPDGRNFSAKVVDRDPLQDLAFIKIESNGLPVVELGDSDRLQVGEQVIAIGNALGEFQNTVTVGVISAKNRQITASNGGQAEPLSGLLQTDAAINSGNSGGPLVNLRGQVIGINTATATKGAAEGIGFAIPTNTVKPSLTRITKLGRIARPMLGVRFANITKELADLENLPVTQGALLVSDVQGRQQAVVAGGPADKAGLKNGDIISHINGDKIDQSNSLPQLIDQYNPGDTVELTVIRDQKTLKIKVRLEELKV